MLTCIRYALATFCFAASVGCLLLSWRGSTRKDVLQTRNIIPGYECAFAESSCGLGRIALPPNYGDLRPGPPIEWMVFIVSEENILATEKNIAENGRFLRSGYSVRFPLWYPALVFALSGVAALRFGRQFSIRSALICLTVVTALLGMAVVL